MVQTKANKDFLKELYKGTQIGIYSIEIMQKNKTAKDNPDFKAELKRQSNEYKAYLTEIKAAMINDKIEAKQLNGFTKTMVCMGLKMRMMFDKSVSNMAEILMGGNQMGVIETTKMIKKYDNAREDIKAFASRMIDIEERNIESLKPFLSPEK